MGSNQAAPNRKWLEGLAGGNWGGEAFIQQTRKRSKETIRLAKAQRVPRWPFVIGRPQTYGSDASALPRAERGSACTALEPRAVPLRTRQQARDGSTRAPRTLHPGVSQSWRLGGPARNRAKPCSAATRPPADRRRAGHDASQSPGEPGRKADCEGPTSPCRGARAGRARGDARSRRRAGNTGT